MDTPIYLTESAEHLEALARVEILYTDLDGTLLGPGGTLLVDGAGSPSTTAATAVVDVNRAGLPVVIVSGRSRLQLVELARICGWNDFIAEAGAIRSRWDGTTRALIFDTPHWPQDLPTDGRTVFEEIQASGAYEALVEAFPRQVEYHDPWHLHRDATHVLRGCFDTTAAQAVLDTFELPMDLLDNGLVRRTSHGLTCDGPLHAYHVVPKGVSKRRAIELDLAERGLAPHQAAIIGDAQTDLQSAPSVGLALLVENALEVPGLAAEAAGYANAAFVRGSRGDGWAAFARLWMDARGE
ncbi:MAG: hypothetical protein U1E26_02270 [Coriobacteriia bacterium]|nr:hypothetical protein [Coriobacteriia bacterium]